MSPAVLVFDNHQNISTDMITSSLASVVPAGTDLGCVAPSLARMVLFRESLTTCTGPAGSGLHGSAPHGDHRSRCLDGLAIAIAIAWFRAAPHPRAHLGLFDLLIAPGALLTVAHVWRALAKR
jgi:hypothetical protein